MKLPELETPKYTLIVPSTGESLEYRPYLVREEKILMVAKESNDSKSMIRAIIDVVMSCTFGKANPDVLTVYDLEYIFIQLRCKSVGETTRVKIPCAKCNEMVEVEIDLSKVELTKGDAEKIIKLRSDVGIELKRLTISDIINIGNDEDMQIIQSVIKSIFLKDDVFDPKKVDADELNRFIDSLNSSELAQIQEFITSQPKITLTVPYVCNKCGHEGQHVFEGISSFFE